MLSLWAIDPAGTPRGTLAPLAGKAVLRHNDISTYTFTLDGRDPLAQRLTKGWALLTTDTGIRFSGAIQAFHTEATGQLLTTTVTGRDELHRLADRVIYPNPARGGDAQDRARYEAKGAAEAVLKKLVTLNAGAEALEPRRSPRFQVEPSSGRGNRVAVSERFSNLLEVAQKIASQGGLAFTATHEDDGQVRFRTRVPRDLTRQVRLPATGETKLEAPTVTAVLMGGQGEGASRRISMHSRDYGWGHRVEVFKDRRDTDDTEAIAGDAAEFLADSSETNSATLQIQEGAHRQFGTDYRLGDLITVELGNTSISEALLEAEVTWTPLGREISLKVGQTEHPRWSARTRDLDRRLRALEADR